MAAKKLEVVENPESVLVKDKPITLTEVYKAFIEKYASHDREQSTIRRYDTLFRNHLEPKWGNRQISSIQATEVSEYLFAMTATHSYAYIMSIHKFIGVLWDYAVRHKYMRNDNFRQIETPKDDSSDDFISEEQLGYINNAESGHGLIKVGGALVPFINQFPRGTALYRLMTTKPGESL